MTRKIIYIVSGLIALLLLVAVLLPFLVDAARDVAIDLSQPFRKFGADRVLGY